MRTLLVGIFACVVVQTGACGKSDSDNFVDNYCTLVTSCCAQANLPGDGKVCRQFMTFAAASGSYNASAGSACLTEMKAQMDAGTFCSAGSTSTPSSCDSVYGQGKKGAKKPGDTCEFDSDCAPSSDGTVTCAGIYTGSTWLNKCQVRMVGKPGDSPCIGTQEGDTFFGYHPSSEADVVSRGYLCDTANNVTCTDGTCVSLAALGATCSSTTDCVRSAYCSSTDRVCTTKIAAGGTCTSIASSECVDSAYCDKMAKQCTAKVANGIGCSSSAVCQSGNCDSASSTCKGSANVALALLCGN